MILENLVDSTRNYNGQIGSIRKEDMSVQSVLNNFKVFSQNFDVELYTLQNSQSSYITSAEKQAVYE